jgi:uncharacterized protein (TIGR03437 family)
MVRIVALLAFSTVAFAQTPTIASVVDSTNYQAQLCPGMLATVFGTNFGSTVSAVSVTVGGVSAYVDPGFLAPTQFSFEIPFELTPGPTTVVVTAGGVQSAPFNITLATYAPSIETLNGSGSGLATVVTGAGKPVTLAAPAHPGDVLTLYAVGLGPTNPATATGLAPASNKTATPTTLTIGGATANVAFAGVAAGFAGLYQVNFTVPTGVQGTVPLVIGINGQTSSTSVTIALAGLSSLVNSASFAAPGTASPGSISTVFFNDPSVTSNELSALFPVTTSEGLQVTIDGDAAPLFAVVGSAGASNPQQVNLYVPTSLPTSGTVTVQLTTSSTFYPNYTLTMVPANPGFFRFTDPKVAALVNVVAQFANSAWLALPVSTTANLGLPACTSSTSLLTVCGQPATIGSVLVLYATGLGLATPNGNPNGTPLPTGQIPPIDGSVLYETPTTPVVTIGGISAKVLYSGLAPGSAGEYQIDVIVPTGVTNGDQIPVVLSILGASDSSTTISIQPGSITPGAS